MSKAAIISRKAMVDPLVDRLSYTTRAVEPLVRDEYADFAEEILIWLKLYSGLKNAYFERSPGPFNDGRCHSIGWYPGRNNFDFSGISANNFSHIEIFREVIAAIEQRKSSKACSCRYVLSPRENPYRRPYFHRQAPF